MMGDTISTKRRNVKPVDQPPQQAEETRPVSPVLARLIEEVRNDGAKSPRAYDRVHNRHNR